MAQIHTSIFHASTLQKYDGYNRSALWRLKPTPVPLVPPRAILHRYRLCFKNEASLPTIKKMSAGATMHLHHRYEANMPPTRLSPTVLGGVLMVETGGISHLRSPPRILPTMADLHIAAKI